MSLSVDGSTGIKLNVYDDLNEVKSEFVHVKGYLNKLQSTIGVLEPDVARLRGTVASLENKLADLRSLGVRQIVSDVVKQVLEETPFLCSLMNVIGTNAVNSLENDISETPSYIGRDSRACPWDGIPNDSGVSAMSKSEAHLLSYLFSKKVKGIDGPGSDEVARYAGWAITRWDLSCLSPLNHLKAEVVDMAVAYLSDIFPDTIFLPSTFSDFAKEYSKPGPAQGLVQSMIELCGLRQYSGKLSSCKKVFIPIQDDKHWFLAVLKSVDGHCEIYDSNPDHCANKRREEYALACTLLLDKVFAEEMTESPAVHPKWGSFLISRPNRILTHQTVEDSGVFVIRNMQFYQQSWYIGFNSGHHRVRLALELVNNPRNEVAGLVWKNATDELQYNSVTPGVPLLSADEEGNVPVGGIKFTPRRSHRFWP